VLTVYHLNAEAQGRGDAEKAERIDHFTCHLCASALNAIELEGRFDPICLVGLSPGRYTPTPDFAPNEIDVNQSLETECEAFRMGFACTSIPLHRPRRR
jgi:hypothetical protein